MEEILQVFGRSQYGGLVDATVLKFKERYFCILTLSQNWFGHRKENINPIIVENQTPSIQPVTSNIMDWLILLILLFS